jgi:hypothetical protein
MKPTLGLCVAILTAGQSAWAAVVTNTAVRDNTLYEYVAADGDKSNGAGANIFAGKTDANLSRRAAVAFSFANVPAGATINSATLRL